MSQINSRKRIELILEANNLVEEPLRCSLGGHPWGPYIHFALEKKYPDWKQYSMKTASTIDGAVNQLARHNIAVDLTKIPGDGGGSQYTFLEAWDAGCVLVIHEDWIRPRGEMVPGVNCLTIGSPEDLAATLERLSSPGELRATRAALLTGYRDSLALHDPATVGAEYAQELSNS